MRHQVNQRGLRVVQLACSLTVGSALALAQNPGEYLSYSWKGIALQPQLDTTALFTDNLFSSAGVNRVSDFMMTFSPGLRLQWGRDGLNQVSFEYHHDESILVDNSDFNSSQNRLALSVRYATGRIRVDGQDSVQFLSSLMGGSTSQLRLLVDRVTLADTYTVTYDWTEKTDFYFRGVHNTTDYDKKQFLLDQTTLEGVLGTSYQWSAKTRVTAEGFYGRTLIGANAAPTIASDSSFYGGFVGLRGNFTSKLTGSGKIGYERRDFVTGDSQGSSTPALAFDLSYQFSPMTSATLRYDRRTAPSPQFGGQISVSDAVSFQVNQMVGNSGKWLVRGNTTFSHNNLTTANITSGAQTINVERTDTILTLGASLVYQPQPWLSCIAAYNFENFDISFASQTASGLLQVVPYHANRVSLSVAVGF